MDFEYLKIEADHVLRLKNVNVLKSITPVNREFIQIAVAARCTAKF